jgi:hypothetical protein
MMGLMLCTGFVYIATFLLKGNVCLYVSYLLYLLAPKMSFFTYTAKRAIAAFAILTSVVGAPALAAAPEYVFKLSVAGLKAEGALTPPPAPQEAYAATLSTPSFPTVLMTERSTGIAVLRNTGTEVLTIGAISAESVTSDWGSFQFMETTCGSSLAPGANCNVTVQFVPWDEAQFTGGLMVSTSAGQRQVTLSATAIAGHVTYSSDLVSFGSVAVGSTVTRTLTITNTGQGAIPMHEMTVFNPSVSYDAVSDYTVAHNCGSSIAVGAVCTITLQFTPEVVGTSPRSLLVNHEGVGPYRVAISGAGL